MVLTPGTEPAKSLKAKGLGKKKPLILWGFLNTQIQSVLFF
jgi:hypothetical protein